LRVVTENIRLLFIDVAPVHCLHYAIIHHMMWQMLITGLGGIDGALRKHSAARQPMGRWIAIVEQVEWHSILDVRQVFPTADLIKGTGLTCFNLGGNKFRLITIISYATQTVAMIELLTHVEYDRKY
jgi:mRNA interferase HigB